MRIFGSQLHLHLTYSSAAGLCLHAARLPGSLQTGRELKFTGAAAVAHSIKISSSRWAPNSTF